AAASPPQPKLNKMSSDNRCNPGYERQHPISARANLNFNKTILTCFQHDKYGEIFRAGKSKKPEKFPAFKYLKFKD
ncbi:hypothetical protein, partial [Chryseobacterium taeanense]|uniref:hypothetical protein n=1 Tax=Chryseobacterium taeanense TaxID=311334 RepID=UPI0035B4B010